MLSLEGNWIGGLTLADTWMFMTIHFKKNKGIITIKHENIFDKALTKTIIENSQVHFKLTDPYLTFDGQLKDNTISGTVTHSEKKGTFCITRVVPVDSELYRKYSGTYRLENERLLLFSHRFGNTAYLEGRSVVDVYPVSDAAFISEKGETIIFDNKDSIIVRKNGLDTPGNRVVLYTEEEVQFFNRDVTLSGTLAIPLTKGPHPAVVLIHGSGAESREGYRFLADHLARHGIAALRYDKRGVGESTGDWHFSTLEDLAEDALAGVHFLQRYNCIHPEKVGLLGTSQGVWIAPLAAGPDVAFIVLISGACVSPKKQELYRVTHEYRYRGLSPKSTAIRVLGYRLEIALATLARALKPAAKVLPKNIAFSLYLDWDFDVVPALTQVACPVLALYGELDKLLPVKESVAILKKALKGKDYTIKIFPKGNHGLLISEVGVWSEVARLEKKEFVPGYYDTIHEWILEKTR